MRTFGIITLLFNIFAALMNYWIWSNTGEDLNLFCFGVSTGISIMLATFIFADCK